MKVLSKSLSDAQKKEFVEHFEDLVMLDDWETDTPWGCAWFIQEFLEGDTIKEMAENYYAEHEADILETAELEQAEREAEEAEERTSREEYEYRNTRRY